MELILASASQRRKELMALMGYDYRICVSHAEENIPFTNPGAFVEDLANIKAQEVLSKNPNACVIGSDTVVWLDDKIIGKPADRAEAYQTLRALSGRTHTVYTGVAICSKDKRITFHDTTSVTFNELSDPEIWAYINTGEPMDKAGAYGIQGPASLFVKKIEGCYFTVIGLPNPRVYNILKEFDIYPTWVNIEK